MKIKAWGIKQAIWGADYCNHYWFASKAARDEYYANHNYCDKLRCRIVDTTEITVYQDGNRTMEVASYSERTADEPAPLTGKYAQLRDDLHKVHKIGLEAASGVEDGGTCNMDAPALRLTRWNRAKVEQACKEAGGGCFKWSLSGRFVICLPTPGQAYKQETAAKAMTKALQALGYDAMTYCQAD